jgi:hypothetical protein
MFGQILDYLSNIQDFIDRASAIAIFNIICHLLVAVFFSRLTFGFFNEVVETRKKAFELVSELLEVKKDGKFKEYRKYVWKYAVITGILVTVIVSSQNKGLNLSWVFTYTILGPFVLKTRFIDPIMTKDFNKVVGAVSNSLPNLLSTVDTPYQEEISNLNKEIKKRIAAMGKKADTDQRGCE